MGTLQSKTATTGAVALSLAALCGFGMTACNALTGADEVIINPNFEADGDDDGSSDSTGGPTGGSGGATSSAGSTGGPTGSGAGSTGSGASGSSSSSGSGMGGDPGPTNCEYPTGPYGVGLGDTVPPTISWEGYAPGGTSPTTLTMSELHDCDGSKGINALYFDTSQFG